MVAIPVKSSMDESGDARGNTAEPGLQLIVKPRLSQQTTWIPTQKQKIPLPTSLSTALNAVILGEIEQMLTRGLCETVRSIKDIQIASHTSSMLFKWIQGKFFHARKMHHVSSLNSFQSALKSTQPSKSLMLRQQLKPLLSISQNAWLGGTAATNAQYMMVSSKRVTKRTLVQWKVPSIARSNRQSFQLKNSVLKIILAPLYSKRPVKMPTSVVSWKQILPISLIHGQRTVRSTKEPTCVTSTKCTQMVSRLSLASLLTLASQLSRRQNVKNIIQ